MFNYRVSFESPWYLLLLAVLPVLWWFSFCGLASLGRVRSTVAIGTRSLVLTLLVLALADIQWKQISDRLTVIYLLDQSASIPAARRRAMIRYVNQAINRHRQDKDRVGVIVFGRDAAIEIPPFDDDVQMMPEVESQLNTDYTNLAGAMKLAQAAFPEDAAKRIVLVSDANQNIGDAREQALGLASAGIGIDVIPVHYRSRAEVVVERLVIPSDVRRGEPFELKVVVNNITEPTADDPGVVQGRLVLSQIVGGEKVVLNPPDDDDPNRDRVTLEPGKHVYPIVEQIDQPNFYTYEVEFIPDRSQDDTMKENNRVTAYTHVRGKGRVLLIEDCENRGECRTLVDRLRKPPLSLEVTVKPSDQLFSGLAELQPYDTVVLANVPRTTSDQVNFSDAQIRMLVRNTQQMGCGLVMLGGPNSFGAGGWTNTELEKAMPVDFQIKSARVVACGALVMIMHACEIPQGNFWQTKIAREAIKTLGPQDYCGLVHWNGTDQWLWGRGLLQVQGNRERMMARVDRMTPGDMPQFDPSMQLALKGFARVPQAAVKHMIIISDGDPSPPSNKVINGLTAKVENGGLNVTISTVAIGAHGPAESGLLQNIAQKGRGKYYQVRNARALPRIFQREARRVARPLIWDKRPVRIEVDAPENQIISGIEGPLPPIKGFVLTSKKENPLVETVLTAPEAAGKRNSTILACWTYGLGKAVAFTSDCGTRWTDQWTGRPVYEKLFGQMVRWSMRPTGGLGKFTAAAEVEGEQVRMVVTALGKDDEFLNFLDMTGAAVGPDLGRVPVQMEQTAPGRYVGTFPAPQPGSYFVMISAVGPDGKTATIRTGINVPYSDEFRNRTANDALLDELAGLTPKGGRPGLVLQPLDGSEKIESLLAVNTFRHGELQKAASSRDAWYYLVFLAGCLFFFDVFFRRVHVSLAWVPPLAGRARDWVLRRQPQEPKPEYIQRLRSRKAQVTGRLEQIRSEARFELPSETPPDLEVLEQPAAPPAPGKKPSMAIEEEPEEESYTERLLRAKKKLWDPQKRKDDS